MKERQLSLVDIVNKVEDTLSLSISRNEDVIFHMMSLGAEQNNSGVVTWLTARTISLSLHSSLDL